MKNNSTSMVIVGVVAIAAIVGLVLLFNAAQTGNAAKTQFYGAGPLLIEKTDYETGRRLMCNDGLVAQPTGNVDQLRNLVEYKCISTPERRWFSKTLTYG